MGRWTRDARLGIARLSLAGMPGLAGSRVPDAPSVSIRDPWPGDTGRGSRLMKGELVFAGSVVRLAPGQGEGQWNDQTVPEALRAHAHGFSWLRDLRALGTDGGRLRARALVLEWLSRPPHDPVARLPHVVASRVTAWLSHFDFFAASADDSFRQKLMTRLFAEARLLAAGIPTPDHDHHALACLKGLLACAVAMPGQSGYLTRTLRHIGPEIGRQILPDGTHAERSPASQLAALRELAEMRLLMQTGQIAPPLAMAAALDRMAPVLRALRHPDGGLALFNGASEENPARIDLVLSQATRGRSQATAMPDGGFVRIQSGRVALIADVGPPPPAGFSANAHAGTLSFELSVGRERLITNCGAGMAPAWRDALRATAAHSTLVVADTSSTEFRAGHVSRRPNKVTVDHHEASGAHWLDLTQDGYLPGFGATHARRIYIAEGGEDIRGEDALLGEGLAEKPVPFALRFHLHPAVTARRESPADEEGGSVLLTLGSGAKWRLRADSGRLAVEESVYLGGETPKRSTQIVIAVTPAVARVAEKDAADPPSATGDAEHADTAAHESGPDAALAARTVRWALSRVDS
ncbi:heparinase II/III family protein [Acetobacteraceae bacterium KSS8]|uniref:Heparinase II/III family protein n=1 Tax=Endosaccharibacter trunci TaxID=2812733 RepID=A0ABT1W8M4_9PROT|nr:heparinase II/III family protein [Acetobacteraceae bacterium KSS8]